MEEAANNIFIVQVVPLLVLILDYTACANLLRAYPKVYGFWGPPETSRYFSSFDNSGPSQDGSQDSGTHFWDLEPATPALPSGV